MVVPPSASKAELVVFAISAIGPTRIRVVQHVACAHLRSADMACFDVRAGQWIVMLLLKVMNGW